MTFRTVGLQTLERRRLSDEHATALTNQRKELAKAAEQSENRLMVLLDQECLAAKEAVTDLADKLSASNDKAQQYREQAIERDSAFRQLTTQNELLTEQLSGKADESVELAVRFEEEIAQGETLRREFKAYKEEHRISGELEALQAAVAGLQEKLEEKQEE